MKANKKENKACIKVGKKEDPRTEGTGKKGEKGRGREARERGVHPNTLSARLHCLLNRYYPINNSMFIPRA